MDDAGHQERKDRCRGAILGLAIGDAFCATTEFNRHGHQPRSILLTGPYGFRNSQIRQNHCIGTVNSTRFACCLPSLT